MAGKKKTNQSTGNPALTEKRKLAHIRTNIADKDKADAFIAARKPRTPSRAPKKPR